MPLFYRGISFYREVKCVMTFDMPNATETFGRRNITASPAQSLAMMNSSFVWKAAEQWKKRILAAGKMSFAERVNLPFPWTQKRKNLRVR